MPWYQCQGMESVIKTEYESEVLLMKLYIYTIYYCYLQTHMFHTTHQLWLVKHGFISLWQVTLIVESATILVLALKAVKHWLVKILSKGTTGDFFVHLWLSFQLVILVSDFSVPLVLLPGEYEPASTPLACSPVPLFSHSPVISFKFPLFIYCLY
jgi:hypothetical protein